jgi:hypothetical protein
MSEERNIQDDATGGLDNLFRKTLENHQVEPSAGTWKAISRKLLRAELTHFNFKNLPKSFWVGSAIALVVGLLFLLNQIPDGTVTENAYNPITVKNKVGENTSLEKSNKETVITGSSSAGIKSKSTIKAFTSGFTAQQCHVDPGKKVLTSGNLILNNKAINKGKTVYTDSIASAKRFSPGKLQSKGDHLAVIQLASINTPKVIHSLNGLSFTNDAELKFLPGLSSRYLYSSGVEDTLLRFTTMNGVMNIPLTKTVEIPQFYTFNLGISPEFAVYRSENQQSEANYWLNAGVTYHVGRFSIQTGLGLGYIYDHGDYRVNYKSKDSIGYFTSIISFIVKPGNLVVYSTKDIPVYDSLQHIADDRAISRYTYLRIPLILGYELFEYHRFGFGIKAGPAFSFLIGSKSAAPEIDYPNARLIRVDNNSLVRIKMNWELQAALDIEYSLAKNFSIYAEPSYIHYFKPFESQESNSVSPKDPFSIGLEIGARYNFRPKRNKK